MKTTKKKERREEKSKDFLVGLKGNGGGLEPPRNDYHWCVVFYFYSFTAWCVPSRVWPFWLLLPVAAADDDDDFDRPERKVSNKNKKGKRQQTNDETQTEMSETVTTSGHSTLPSPHSLSSSLFYLSVFNDVAAFPDMVRLICWLCVGRLCSGERERERKINNTKGSSCFFFFFGQVVKW